MAPWAAPALVGVAGVAAARIIGLKLWPALEWPLLFAVLVAASALCIRMRAERAYRPKRIMAALGSLIEGSELDTGRLARDGMGDDLLALLGRLNEAIRSLRADKSRAEMVLSEIADGIITVDAGGEVTVFNRAAETMLGASASRVLGSRIDEADLHPEIARMAADCISGSGAMSAEIRLPGVPEKVIGIRAAPFSQSQRGESALLLLRDLSEMRRHEKTQKEFVSNVSHELRTPITAVRATAEALLAGAKNDEELVGRFLKTILSESDRLSALIDDLMEIAKRESGIVRTQKTEVNVAEAVRLALATVRPLAEQNQV